MCRDRALTPEACLIRRSAIFATDSMVFRDAKIAQRGAREAVTSGVWVLAGALSWRTPSESSIMKLPCFYFHTTHEFSQF